jgi:hypothetical protein
LDLYGTVANVLVAHVVFRWGSVPVTNYKKRQSILFVECHKDIYST